MSLYPSYTDLHNKIRENIAVGHDPEDRATLQKVKFLNDENEYWGVFCGKINSPSIQAISGTLKDVTLTNCSIKTPEGQVLNLDVVAQNFESYGEDISVLDTNIEELQRQNICLKNKIQELVQAINKLADEVDTLKKYHSEDPEDPENPEDPDDPGEDPGEDHCPICGDDCTCGDDCDCNNSHKTNTPVVPDASVTPTDPDNPDDGWEIEIDYNSEYI